MKTEQAEQQDLTKQIEQAEQADQAEQTQQTDQAEQTATNSDRNRKQIQGGWFNRAFQVVFSPIHDVLDGVDMDFSDRTASRKALISMLKLRVPICILLVVVIACGGIFFLLRSDGTAMTDMSLNYEESANGLNPNSTRFNAYDVASPEVVEGMLSYCGIDLERVDLNEVTNCISIRATNAKAFSEDNYYISTSYKITMHKPKSIQDVGVNELLTFLCKAYKDHLYSKYTENRSILDFDIDMFNDVEFLQIADLLDLKATQIEKYLNTRVKQSKTFTEASSDETFKSIAQKVEDLRTYDIAKYRAFIIQAGCSYDKARYIRALAYTNRIKKLSYDKDLAAYNVRNEGIQMYNESMISVVMIPSIDESKNTYYMSKTKTGMDYMANQADDYLLTAEETAKEIATNQDIITKMRAGTNTPSDIRKANLMIEEIRQKFVDLSRQIETIDKAYIKYKTKDYLTFKTTHLSLLQKLNAEMLAVLAAVLLLGMFCVLWIRFRFYGGGKKA